MVRKHPSRVGCNDYGIHLTDGSLGDPGCFILSLYLHLGKPLPRELIPFGSRVLESIETTHKHHYECDHLALGIAQADLEEGFSILKRHFGWLQEDDWRRPRWKWNPIEGYASHDFWDYLNSQDAERAYREFCNLNKSSVGMQLNNNRPVLDLERDRAVLVKLANENENNAERIAISASIKQPGFFPFAFEMLAGRPIDGSIAASLASTIFDLSGFGHDLDKLRLALNNVESELKKPNLPTHGRDWLESLRKGIQIKMRDSPWNGIQREHLGWS